MLGLSLALGGFWKLDEVQSIRGGSLLVVVVARVARDLIVVSCWVVVEVRHVLLKRIELLYSLRPCPLCLHSLRLPPPLVLVVCLLSRGLVLLNPVDLPAKCMVRPFRDLNLIGRHGCEDE